MLLNVFVDKSQYEAKCRKVNKSVVSTRCVKDMNRHYEKSSISWWSLEVFIDTPIKKHRVKSLRVVEAGRITL